MCRLAAPGAKILKIMPGIILRLRTRDFLKISKTPKRRRRQRCRQHSEDDRRLSTCNRALSAYLEKLPSGPRHQASRISHLTSNWDDVRGPYLLLDGARSPSEAIFFQNPQKCQAGRILKIPKNTGLPRRSNLKYILGAAQVAKS